MLISVDYKRLLDEKEASEIEVFKVRRELEQVQRARKLEKDKYRQELGPDYESGGEATAEQNKQPALVRRQTTTQALSKQKTEVFNGNDFALGHVKSLRDETQNLIGDYLSAEFDTKQCDTSDLL